MDKIHSNIENSETLCIHCEGWGKVPVNQRNKSGEYMICKTCNGSMLIKRKNVAHILGSSTTDHLPLLSYCFIPEMN